MKTKSNTAHVAAFITIIIWASTFVSTKILLREFQPIEILAFRFFIGYLALWVIYPKRFRTTQLRHEIYFALAGISGISLYFLLENIALTYTSAANVGIIISVAPFFTAILAGIFLKKEEKLNVRFFLGFLLAIFGIVLISFKGSIQLHTKGDFLALCAAVTWACYSVLTKKIGDFGYHSIQVTRKIFGYGLLFILPALFLFDFRFGLKRFQNSINLFNMCFLGLGASALCFVTWNYAVKILGAIKTSIYIYIVPVMTLVISAIILQEVITLRMLIGVILTIMGLFLSEKRSLAQGTKKSKQEVCS